MDVQSIWQTTAGTTHFPPLEEDLTVDVAIIGAGLTGIACAQALSEAGYKVAVLEARKIGESNTAHSTGNLYSVYPELLKETRNSYGAATVERIAQSRREAIDLIEANVHRFSIDCDFRRVPWFYFSAHKEADDIIEKAKKTLEEINIPFDYGTFPDSRLRPRKAIKVPGQAQFNPQRYVQGLAQAIRSENCRIFEDTKVEEIVEGQMKNLVTEGGQIWATHLIHATHSPKGFMPIQSMLGPYREYGIACKIKEPQQPAGIYFGYYNSSHITSVRHYERSGEHFLIVVGEPHKVGQGDSLHRENLLENFAARHFEVIEVTHRWSGQHYRPADHVPYIGRRTKGNDTYIVTGLSTHGLVYGTLAGPLLTDLISGRENPFGTLYSPTRFTPLRSAPKFLKENTNVLGQLVKDYIGPKASELSPGEGKVLEFDGHLVAAHRNEAGLLQVCSAICTHMGCVVHWNNAEESWDCPCHGSRFERDGEVIEGPALRALAPAEEVKDEFWKTTAETARQDLFIEPEGNQ